jgi:hypothetical protein
MKGLPALFLYFLCSCSSNNSEPFIPRDGDIFFQDIDCGPFCESIEQVTQGYKGARLSHCGIYLIKDGKGVIIEAGSEGVVYTNLELFLSRTLDENKNPKVMVGRVLDQFQPEIPIFIKSAETYVGRPYDSYFNLQNDSLYCSELVYLTYKVRDCSLFRIQPMTFKAPGVKQTFEEWQNYFDHLGVGVPEGKPGLNPGSISLSENLKIIHIYGDIDGIAHGN